MYAVSQSLGLTVVDGQMAFFTNVLHQPLNFMLFISAFSKKSFEQWNRLTRTKRTQLKSTLLLAFAPFSFSLANSSLTTS